MLATRPIYCCSKAVPSHTSQNNKPHNDPNRAIHDAIFRSFLGFAARRERQLDLTSFVNGNDHEDEKKERPDTTPSTEPWVQVPVLTPEALANNLLTSQTPYVIHLTSREDFGPVRSHRYFVCPSNLEDDWVEMTLIHWFAEGYPFRMTSEKWDVKCEEDGKFFRMTLRPNLNLRWRQVVAVKEPEVEDSDHVEGEDFEEFDDDMEILDDIEDMSSSDEEDERESMDV